MAKTYINAKLQVVRMSDDIVTTSIPKGNPFQNGDPVLAPERDRKSIWD
jgi:hypothetical protein